jgi:hypothetical protein
VKLETSVLLPEELERALRGARDLEIMNANAEYLSEEALDALEYQIDPDELAGDRESPSPLDAT